MNLLEKEGCLEVIKMIANVANNFKDITTKMIDFDVSSIVTVDTGITSIAVSLTSMFFAMAIFSEMAMFRVERIEEAIKVAMKFVVAKIIIENSSGISKGIFGMFRKLGKATIEDGYSALTTMVANLGDTIVPEDGGFWV